MSTAPHSNSGRSSNMPPPILPDISKAKQLSGKKTEPTTSLFVTLILFSPVLFLFFLGGVYFGSSLAEQSQPTNLSNSFPGTRSILDKWNSNHLNISSLAPPVMQNFLRHHSLEAKSVRPPHIADSPEAMEPPQVVDPPVERGVLLPLANEVTTEKEMVPPVEDHPITGAEISRLLTSSLHVTNNVMFLGPTNLDAPDIVIGAWVFLDDIRDDHNMRTIFTNKQSGCEQTKERNGIAMFVNEWGTNNHQLYVEYGNSISGCNKVTSDGIQLHPKQWYHVAVTMIDTVTELYIDGTVVGRSDQSMHTVQSSLSLVVGAFHDGEYPLYGNVSHLAIAHPNQRKTEVSSIDVAEAAKKSVKKMMHVAGDKHKTPQFKDPDSDGSELIALFEFSDFDSVVKKGTAGKAQTLDSLSHLSGTYLFPERISAPLSVPGVPIKLVTGLGENHIVTEEMKKESDQVARTRREEIKKAMEFVWSGYKKYAWGRDELKPMSNAAGDPWGGMGVTLVDSLDTLWVMGMKTEFNEAVEWIKKSLSFNRVGVVSVFETTIRELGGLLSAYDLSGEKILLDKAEDLGSRLIHAFDGGIGLPRSQVDLSKRSASNGWSGSSAILAELGTLQVEFRYLSHATTNPSYEDISMEAIKLMATKSPPHGLYPIKVGFSRGEFTDSTVTFGALGDSFYEYLLKLWLQGNREEMWLRNMYDRAIDGVIKILLKASSKTGLAFLSDWNGVRNDLKMDHLVCFMPGILTLGAYTDPAGLQSERAQRDLNVAKALMFTCREMYHRTKSGIAPEFVRFDNNDMNTRTTASFYILRPETAESLYVMSHLTGDPIYRDWAWEIWKAIDRNCRVGSGFGSLRDVNAPGGGGIDDRMESFFLAETMKYLYLAQDPDSEINLMDYVFNTEAHPMKIFKKGTHQAIQMK